MRSPPRARRLLWTAIAIGGLVATIVLGYQVGGQSALRQQTALAQQQLQLQAQALDQRIERYRALPQLLALDPDLRAAVAAPVDAPTRERLNRRLEEANRTAQASTLTLIGADGTAIAASNWRTLGSNVGERYAFRPYVQQALREGSGRFYGIGVTTGVPGYFLSEALRDADGRAVGVIVIKLELTQYEERWPHAGNVVLASDRYGIVFLASRPEWRYRVLAPLSDSARAELESTRQYGRQPLRPFAGTIDADALARIDNPAMSGRWLWQRTPLADTDWTLHLLQDATPVAIAAWQWAGIAGVSWIALVFVVLFAQQRLRLAALRRRSREELETLVRQHAEELRTAKDGLVAAAQEADTGLSRRLAHLPQGVVIIDAQLRIVAWNARYIELFRFPPDLVRVGTPIEDVFRYNARRGLLGPGPVEDAIERRLDHLRSGKPHARESEKSDGTVLEIRGNPLPDGGFVTSYADITAYKTTARELRTLADALEQRIAERTADLEQARREAEAANRQKGRFAAAAVHDLLQPLNAARMFVSALRARLPNAETRTIVDSIESALSAQDGILTSLLDVSRLESGTLQADVRDVPLGPVLEALAREAGVLAQARGLQLDAVPTRAWVRSDPVLLRRLVQNFLSNAVRYTAHGRILLGCRREGTSLRIEVHDTGPGIAPNRQREIFEEFRRLDDGGGDDRGVGLGLSIVERIARLLGHRIGLRSQPGVGSVFSVTVPLAPPGAHPAPAPTRDPGEDSPLRGCRVWYIDSDVVACEAMRERLAQWQCTVAFVGAPADAVTLADGAAAPDVLLLCERGNAADVAALWRQLQASWEDAPLVILLAEREDAGLRALVEAGDWSILPMPVRPPALRALLSQRLLRRG
ncbi:PAS-domain containing protein [Luteimonas sp. RC10]|uniref:PAS-domain containing protein n=1 Tax=Luteimonas sp. RC10 TaxID=2587035 RepID=UPI00161FCB56|nr:PAS-domain containing protein [Luteimonas sp. RC10]MBB3344770.1 histidine kinase [Luteimonas sp. RC10]